MLVQPPLFDLPEPAAPGWRPQDLGAGTHITWTAPAEIEGRLDATYYVITKRPERLLGRLACPLAPLAAWAAVNPPEGRLPAERGYLLFEDCLYAEVRDVRDGCWVIGPQLRRVAVRDLPRHAAHQPVPGDVLLPRYTSSMHRAVVVWETAGPLIVSQNFHLLRPRSHDYGLALLALLHHRVMGEQLWALTTGTMKRAVAAGKLTALQVPELPLDALSALVTLVEQLLQAQTAVAFPGRRIPLRLYWMDGSLSRWERRAHELMQEIERCIDEMLGILPGEY